MNTAIFLTLIICAALVLLAAILVLAAGAVALPMLGSHLYRCGTNKTGVAIQLPSKPAPPPVVVLPTVPRPPDRVCPNCEKIVAWRLSADRSTWSCPTKDCTAVIPGPNISHKS